LEKFLRKEQYFKKLRGYFIVCSFYEAGNFLALLINNKRKFSSISNIPAIRLSTSNFEVLIKFQIAVNSLIKSI